MPDTINACLDLLTCASLHSSKGVCDGVRQGAGAARPAGAPEHICRRGRRCTPCAAAGHPHQGLVLPGEHHPKPELVRFPPLAPLCMQKARRSWFFQR